MLQYGLKSAVVADFICYHVSKACLKVSESAELRYKHVLSRTGRLSWGETPAFGIYHILQPPTLRIYTSDKQPLVGRRGEQPQV